MSAERRKERQIRDAYETLLDDLVERVSDANYAVAVELAEVPERIRGYGHVKQAHIERAEELHRSLLEKFERTNEAEPRPVEREVVA